MWLNIKEAIKNLKNNKNPENDDLKYGFKTTKTGSADASVVARNIVVSSIDSICKKVDKSEYQK